jgi:hypothetical protein
LAAVFVGGGIASHADRGGDCLDAAAILTICTCIVIADWVGKFNKYFWTVGMNHGVHGGHGEGIRLERMEFGTLIFANWR